MDLAKLRFDAGLSPEELGKECRVSGHTIRRIEDGATRPTPRVAKKLADHFGVTASELFPPVDKTGLEDSGVVA
jgi:transcriptional regulator with XRE-family HTH domain